MGRTIVTLGIAIALLAGCATRYAIQAPTPGEPWWAVEDRYAKAPDADCYVKRSIHTGRREYVFIECAQTPGTR